MNRNDFASLKNVTQYRMFHSDLGKKLPLTNLQNPVSVENNFRDTKLSMSDGNVLCRLGQNNLNIK